MLTMCQINHILGLVNQRERDLHVMRFTSVGKAESINTPVKGTRYESECKLFISYSYHNSRFFLLYLLCK